MSDERKYSQMRDAGATAAEVCQSAEEDGLGQIQQIRILRELFGLSLGEAKEVMVAVHTGRDLNEYKKEVVTALSAALEEIESDDPDRDPQDPDGPDRRL